MNVHVSYKVSKTPDLEKIVNRQIEKLGRYLQVFRPDLIHLKGVVEENSAPPGFLVSLNLRLPSGQMTSRESSATAVAAVKVAFEAITEQVKKHKALLRSHHHWPRRRAPQRPTIGTVPFEQTVAAIKAETISAGDISGYVNVNLPRFQRFIERELSYRESLGQISAGQIEVEDVLGEAIARALGEQNDIPERIKLEPWLYRLATQALDQLASSDDKERDVPLERSLRSQNVQGTDEARLQFHQADDSLFAESVIPDPAAHNPEELAARRELIGLVESTLGDAGRDIREAFILYTIEGFTLEEIADITGRNVEGVRASIRAGRQHLQRVLPLKDSLAHKLVEYAGST